MARKSDDWLLGQPEAVVQAAWRLREAAARRAKVVQKWLEGNRRKRWTLDGPFGGDHVVVGGLVRTERRKYGFMGAGTSVRKPVRVATGVRLDVHAKVPLFQDRWGSVAVEYVRAHDRMRKAQHDRDQIPYKTVVSGVPTTNPEWQSAQNKYLKCLDDMGKAESRLSRAVKKVLMPALGTLDLKDVIERLDGVVVLGRLVVEVSGYDMTVRAKVGYRVFPVKELDFSTDFRPESVIPEDYYAL